jgi:hypothetical protein
MAMIDEVQEVCNRLAEKGWGKLLLKHGLASQSPTCEPSWAVNCPRSTGPCMDSRTSPPKACGVSSLATPTAACCTMLWLLRMW